MIYTVTLNPAIDRELTVPAIEFNSVLRAAAQRADCGGKGFNVSRMVAQLGGKSVAIAFAAGHSGRWLQEKLAEAGVATDFVWTEGETRTNTTIVTEQGGRYVKANEAGAAVSAENIQTLLNKIRQLAQPNDWWVLAGSLPPNVPLDIYAQLITILNNANANVILDTSSIALQHGCSASPRIIKPNDHEAKQLTSESNPHSALKKIQQMGIANPIISLGADGVIYAEKDQIATISPPRIHERNPIGAGDALVGGLVWGLESGFALQEAVRWGVACGTVAASLDGTAFGSYAEVEAIFGRCQAKTLS